jgi:hypothetical protein
VEKACRTAEALKGGWMHTGDIGFFDEGGWFYRVDRKKDMIPHPASRYGPARWRMCFTPFPVYAKRPSSEFQTLIEERPSWLLCRLNPMPRSM